MTRKKWILIIVIICCFLSIVLYRSCTQNNLAKKPQIVVAVSSVKQQDVTVYATAIGNVVPYSTVNIKSQVNGTLLSVGFKEGEVVKENQLLFSIDPRSYQIALDQAKANLERDKAALATAKLALERNQSLLGKGYVSKQDYDTLKNNVNSLNATLAADESAIENAKLQLSYCNIYAPIEGRTGNLLVKPGNLVKSSDTNPLVVINQVKPIYVSFNMPEDQLDDVRRVLLQHPIDVMISPDKETEDFTLKGSLTFIDNAVDPTTGTIQLKATLTNEDLSLWPGQFVKIKIPIAYLKQALMIPTNAVQVGPNGSYVFVVKPDQHVKLQPIKTGAAIGSEIVVLQGLNLGSIVVTEGHLSLTDGVLVQTQPARGSMP